MTIKHRLAGPCLVMLFIFLSAAPLFCAPAVKPAVPDTGKVTLDFKDAQLEEVVKIISELTGKNFVYDKGLKGDITIVAPQSVTREEAYELFLTILNVKGYTVIPSGKVHKIVPVAQARESNIPTVTQAPRQDSLEQYVTRLIPLKFVDAAVISQTVLQPLLPKTSNVAAYAPTNTLIVTDSAANIDRLVRIVRQLDIPSSVGRFEIIPLENASAEEVAEICQQFFSKSATPATAVPDARTLRRQLTTGRVNLSVGGRDVTIVPYPRTNVLIVMSDTTELSEIRRLIRNLDSKRKPGTTNFHVYRLENADAETLAKTLNETLTKIPSGKTTPAVPKTKEQQDTSLSTAVISPDKPTNALLINAAPEDYEIIQDLIQKLDIRRKQVYVEALLIELSMDATKNLGVSLQGAAKVHNDSVVFGTSNLNVGTTNLGNFKAGSDGTVNLLSQTIQGILLGGIFNPITVTGINGELMTIPAISALIQLSKTTADVNILSAPRLLTSDNEEAEIIVGSNVPIITNRLTDTGSVGLATSVSVERKDVALTLRFTPQITAGNLVRLKVYQEITDVASTSVGDVNEVGPTLTKRLIQNSILAEDGQTVVMGGLTSTNLQETVNKVPLLGSIPLLGWLFKSSGTTEKKTNLFVFITAHIINDAGDIQRITLHNQQEIELQQKEMDNLRDQKKPLEDLTEKPDKRPRYRRYSRGDR